MGTGCGISHSEGGEIGHALQKRRRREELTLFVACTDEGEFNLCVDNASGAVVLEQPGQPPSREVAPSLAALLGRMEAASPIQDRRD